MTVNNRHLVCVLLVLLGLQGCQLFASGDSSGGSSAEVCSDSWQKQYVYDQLHDFYLWYDHVEQADPLTYESPEAVLSALKYSALDKWSYIADAEEFNSLTEEGKYIGVGVRFVTDADGVMSVAFVYPNSPAAATAIKRGDRLVSVNGVGVEELKTDDGWAAAWGETAVGVSVALVMQDPDSSDAITYSLAKAEITITTVPVVSTFDTAQGKVGYLLFTSFLSTSDAELSDAFTTFKEQSVSQVILDLRYNPGGQLSTSAFLGSLIGGATTTGQVFAALKYNDQYQASNSTFKFSTRTNALGLSQVVVLTSEETCSASEALINGLKPFVNVLQIGGATCGKPVGMNPDAFCDKVMVAINFEYVNANGDGAFYDGITPQCGAGDDLQHELGDSSEAMLAAGLDYLATGNCAAVSSAKFKAKSFANKPITKAWRRIYGID